MSTSLLFKPLKVGKIELQHRVAMAPLTRFRAQDSHAPSELMVEYYGQRASVPGTMITTEGTLISPRAGGFSNVPMIYTDDQKAAWRRVTDAVHERGSYIFCQLWALGRAVDVSCAEQEGIDILGPSPIPQDSRYPTPRQMEISDIRNFIDDYVQAAHNAIEVGFDGVELHALNGFLLDQFLQTNANQRNDEYGGDIEHRSRFPLEVVKAVVNAVGASRTAIRLSPWSTYNNMRMDDPIPQFRYFIQQLNPLGLAYLHLVESRISGTDDVSTAGKLDFAIQAWKGTLYINGGYNLTSAQMLVDADYPGRDIVVVFGRHFLANPDLPFRLKNGILLNPYDRESFYTPKSAEGYITYPFSKEFLEQSAAHKGSENRR